MTVWAGWLAHMRQEGSITVDKVGNVGHCHPPLHRRATYVTPGEWLLNWGKKFITKKVTYRTYSKQKNLTYIVLVTEKWNKHNTWWSWNGLDKQLVFKTGITKSHGKSEIQRFQIYKLLPWKQQVQLWVFVITVLNIQVSLHRICES
jgi:hypothetical protein